MVDLSRRRLAIGLALAPTVMSAASWSASKDEVSMEGTLPPLPEDLLVFADEPAYREYSTNEFVGTGKPTEGEINMAAAIALKAPFGVAPYQVAEFFLAVATEKFGKEWQPYAREWPVRGNPLIMGFFRTTKTIPQGDTTPWCAAFVNWCIAQGNARAALKDGSFSDRELNVSSRSASSGSFRCWAETKTPKIGDLAVFAEPGTERLGCSGSGHVSFYYGRASDGRLRILGGNQTLKGTSGAVTVGLYPLDGAESGRLKFLGFRTSPALHIQA